jgi:hypothetical protein
VQFLALAPGEQVVRSPVRQRVALAPYKGSARRGGRICSGRGSRDTSRGSPRWGRWVITCAGGTGEAGGGSGEGGAGGSHKYAGKKVSDILKEKKGSVKDAPLEPGAPEWKDILNKTWDEIDRAAKADKPGYKTIRKLLTDRRFDK